MISWPDGSMYMGEWFFGKIQGKGIFISKLKDVYKGSMVDGLFEGVGELIYSNGSVYCGDFKKGYRHGRGVLIDYKGNEYYGNYIDDVLHGECIVKAIVEIEEKGQSNYEIRVGVYAYGKFLNWKSKFANQVATKRFVNMFKDDKDMFDSVYSMLVAKNLPNLPNGIDPADEEVQEIVIKIRNDAGMLVGQQALHDARQILESSIHPIRDKEAEVESLKKELEVLSVNMISLDHEIIQLNKKHGQILQSIDKLDQKIEQSWHDDPLETRPKYLAAVKALSAVPADEFFKFKNYRMPPPFVKKIMNAICYLIHLPTDWSTQKVLISDNVFNGRFGDEDAIRFKYDCKFVFMLQSYDLLDIVRGKSVSDEEGEWGSPQSGLNKILADPRFRSDSYYIESTGMVGPLLVDWIKANYAYLKVGRAISSIMELRDHKTQDASRVKAACIKRQEELSRNVARVEEAKNILIQSGLELQDLHDVLDRANKMFKFIEDSFDYNKKTMNDRMDYYAQLEREIEKQKDLFDVQTSMEFLKRGVEQRMDDERRQKIRIALAKAQVYVEPVVSKTDVKELLLEEVLTQQSNAIESGYSLGYSFQLEGAGKLLSEEKTHNIVCLCAELVLGKVNEVLNESPIATEWTTLKGKKFTARCIYVIAWKMFKEEAIAKRDNEAIAAWEAIFFTPEECAKMAIESRVNIRMSSIAKQQAHVWAKKHRLDIEMAENTLAQQFAVTYPGDDTGRMALDISEDNSGTILPAAKAECICWIKLNSEEFGEARDKRNSELADFFSQEFSGNAAETCFNILNGIANEQEMAWIDYADHWKAFHMDEYSKTSDALIDSMAKDFQSNCESPNNCHVEAAKVIDNDAVSKFIVDKDVQKEFAQPVLMFFNATCFAMRNQGMLRKARQILLTENTATVLRQWREFTAQTENFKKGSYLLLPANAKDDPSADRFLGFRKKLFSRFAWMYGYINKRHADLVKEIGMIDLKNPTTKIYHNIRPSVEEKYKRKQEKEFEIYTKTLDNSLADIISKISTWNSYFGISK